MMTEQRLFHFALVDSWKAGLSESVWSPASLDSEGFVHLSFAEQLQGTLDTHYKDAAQVMLLELNRDGLGDDLKLEVSRGGALFPHLYRSIRREEFSQAWELTRDAADGWSLPPL